MAGTTTTSTDVDMPEQQPGMNSEWRFTSMGRHLSVKPAARPTGVRRLHRGPARGMPLSVLSLGSRLRRSISQAAKVCVGFILGRLQVELDVKGRHPSRDRDHRIEVEF